jgi:adenylosuccinate lyase
MMAKMRWVADGMIVDEGRMQHNLESSMGLVHSQSVLSALLSKSSLQREQAYELVQRNAMRAWDEGIHLKELLLNDPEVSAHLAADEIDSCFDANRYLENVKIVFERLEGL